ncbi:MAG: DUF1559 domain-containing protein [Gemmataceae bacterium]|nr:DUF1559 domain-containing protein [Gemmataceae bacterium]MCI0739704.1 DUF1559 domain-containing protein [Gemmataceae bacterium]
MKQLALAVHGFHDSVRHLPVNSLVGTNYGPHKPNWSWLARVLPYLEQAALHDTARISINTLYQSREQAKAVVAVFLCPSDNAGGPRPDAADLGVWNPPFMEAGPTNYKGVSGANWAWGEKRWHNIGVNGEWDAFTRGDGLFYRSDYLHKKNLLAITDGTSNTFMIGEDVPEKTKWCSWPYANNAVGTCAIAPNARRLDGKDYDPWDWENNYSFRSRHPGGLHFAFADGSVRFVHDSIALQTYRAMATIQGGEVVSHP